jgi:hypothetical protein
MHTRRLALAMAGLLLCAVAGPAAAAPKALFLNGRPVPFSIPALDRSGAPLFPLKEWGEALGGTVTATGGGQVQTRLPDGRVISVTVGAQNATIRWVNGQTSTVALERAVEMQGNRSYLPVGNLSRALGADVRSMGDQTSISGLAVQAEVIDGPLNVRGEPNTSSPILMMASNGSVFPVVAIGSYWHQVRLPDGKLGWVSAQFTKLIKQGNAPLGLQIPGYLEVDSNCLGPVPVTNTGLFAPLRVVSEAAGATVTWDGSANFALNGKTARFTPGSATAIVNGEAIQITGVPYIVDGTTWVPVDPLADALGVQRAWNNDRRTLSLTTGQPRPAGALTCGTPLVNAAAYMILDGKTGTPLAEFRADTQRPIASTTKTMTALLALERGTPDSIVTVSRYADNQICTCAYIRTGERLPLGKLLYGMMLPSGNDAASAIAEHVGGGSEYAFVQMMNARAKELGAYRTFYTTPSGLDDYSSPYSTARDLALVARQGMGRPDFRQVVATKLYLYGGHTWENSNLFLKTDPTATGVKNGWTEKALSTLVTGAYRNGQEVIVVILGAPTKDALYSTARTLMDYGFKLKANSFALK